MYSGEASQQLQSEQDPVRVFITSSHGTRVALSSPRQQTSNTASAASSSGGAGWMVELAGQMLNGEGLLKQIAAIPGWASRRSDEAARWVLLMLQNAVDSLQTLLVRLCCLRSALDSSTRQTSTLGSCRCAFQTIYCLTCRFYLGCVDLRCKCTVHVPGAALPQTDA